MERQTHYVSHLIAGAILFLVGAALRHWADPIAHFISGK